MARVVNREAFHARLDDLPQQLATNVLRGGLRALVVVIADEAYQLCISEEVRAAIKVSTRVEPGLVTAKLQVKGKGAYLAPWLEHGTDPHFIAVADSQRDGRSVRRINELHRDGVLVINGQFVSGTVHHPGASPHPFIRPAVDTKFGAGMDAMAGYVRTRLTKEGIATPYSEADDK